MPAASVSIPAMEWLADAWLSYQNLAYDLGLNALLALSMYITLAAGQLSLAQAAFMGIGAYVAALLTLRAHAPFAVALLAGTLAPPVVALLVGLPALRLRGVFLAIATVGFGEVVRITFLNLEATGGALGLNGIPQLTSLWHVLAALGIATFVFWRLHVSKAGLALEAIRQDETAARGAGIEATRLKVATFVAGAGLAGCAGALSAHHTFFIAPNEYGFGRAVAILLFAVVGGQQVFWGPLLGSTVLTLLPEALRSTGLQAGAWRQLIHGAVLVAVVLFAPRGLAGLWLARRRGKGQR